MKTLIIVIVCVVIAVVAGTILVGNKTFDGTVVDKPYDKGLKWDKTQAALKDFTVTPETKIMGRGENIFVFTITPNKDRPIESVSVTITKPSTTRFDRSFEAIKGPDSKYRVAINLPDPGQWDIKVSFVSNQDTLSYLFRYTIS